MKLIKATLRIYGSSITDAVTAFPRSAVAFVVLLVAGPLLLLVGTLVQPAGIIGGMLYTLTLDAIAGTYLASLQDSLASRRAVGFNSLSRNLGAYTWDIVAANFPVFIVSLITAPLGVVGTVVSVLLFVVLNPVPEMIGRSQQRGLDLLLDAARFVKSNAVEWFLAIAVVMGPFVALLGFALVSGFGATFGFITTSGSLFTQFGSGPLGFGLGVVGLLATHLIMLFRGALYQRLSTTGRRGRVWQEAFR